MDKQYIISLLKEKVKPALGCTEPAAIAIAVARARDAACGQVEHVRLITSGNVFKNANGVGIPGTKECGIPFAVLLALACGDADKGLEVFNAVDASAVARAYAMLGTVPVEIAVDDTQGSLYIEAVVRGGQATGRCVIRDEHTGVALIQQDEKILFSREKEAANTAHKVAHDPLLKNMTVKGLRELVESLPLEDIAFLIAGVPMNMRMAEIGLEQAPGLGLGAALQQMMTDGVLSATLINKIRMTTAAAADARMAGLNMPVMSSAGSGNHGITAILPPYLLYREHHLNEEQLIRALALSHLVTIAIKEYSGPLSPVCGCAIAAGIGAAVSMTWLLGGTDAQIAGVINSMSGTLAGMLCDGAKGGCAFKLSTAAGEAALYAHLAIKNIFITKGQGIVSVTPETTIQNVGLISSQGMKYVDSTVINVMLAEKEKV